MKNKIKLILVFLVLLVVEVSVYLFAHNTPRRQPGDVASPNISPFRMLESAHEA